MTMNELDVQDILTGDAEGFMVQETAVGDGTEMYRLALLYDNDVVAHTGPFRDVGDARVAARLSIANAAEGRVRWGELWARMQERCSYDVGKPPVPALVRVDIERVPMAWEAVEVTWA